MLWRPFPLVLAEPQPDKALRHGTLANATLLILVFSPLFPCLNEMDF